MNALVDMQGTAVELNYLSHLAELDNAEVLQNLYEFSLVQLEPLLVGAGVGGGFEHTDELKVLKYRQAMASSDKAEWDTEIKAEHDRFKKFKVVKVVPKSELPRNAKILTTTWAFKKKSNGTRRGRLNARGYEQLEGQHYYADSIAAPVTNPVTIRSMWVLLCANPMWVAEALDVEGAFLQGMFTNGEVIYIEVPNGMEQYYGKKTDVVLLLLKPIYGTKQAASCFSEALVKAIKNREQYDRSKADPCLYFAWQNGRLVIFLSWVDDLMILGHRKDVMQVKRDVRKMKAQCQSTWELSVKSAVMLMVSEQ